MKNKLKFLKFSKKTLISFDIIIILVLSVYLLIGIRSAPFHGDEATLISSSKDYHYIFHEHNVQKVIFHLPYDDAQFVRLTTGSIYPFSVWISWCLAGYKLSEINDFWKWNPEDYNLDNSTDMFDYNINSNSLPNHHLLLLARSISALFTIFSIIVLFLITKKLTNSHLAAWISILVFISTPAVLINGLRAFQEGAMFFFTSLIIYISLFIYDELNNSNKNYKKMLGYYFILSLLSALAFASKHSSLIVIVIAYVSLFTISLLKLGSLKSILREKTTFVQVQSFILIFVFYIWITPIWWNALVINLSFLVFVLILFSSSNLYSQENHISLGTKILIIFIVLLGIVAAFAPFKILYSERLWLMELQNSQIDKINSFKESIILLIKESFFSKAQYFEVSNWKNYATIRNQIIEYEKSYFRGNDGGILRGVILILLFFKGLVASCLQIYKRKRKDLIILLVWFFFPAAILLFTNSLPWQRYYIILHMQIGIIAGIGTVYIKNLFVSE
ncbi:MAG: phospholipid carrier-dependent glycosyltransferase [Bacteroidales bacterium]|nr:phospholipid carrier-dependent glycosyltransferase [Bacteroidales bacterium]